MNKKRIQRLFATYTNIIFDDVIAKTNDKKQKINNFEKVFSMSITKSYVMT